MKKQYASPSAAWTVFLSRDPLTGAQGTINSDVDLPVEPGIGDPPD